MRMMEGLIHDAQGKTIKHKAIKFIRPSQCYGEQHGPGQDELLLPCECRSGWDLPVDGGNGNEMVKVSKRVLDQLA